MAAADARADATLKKAAKRGAATSKFVDFDAPMDEEDTGPRKSSQRADGFILDGGVRAPSDKAALDTVIDDLYREQEEREVLLEVAEREEFKAP